MPTYKPHSTKTRIKTYLDPHCHHNIRQLTNHTPQKQGLRLFVSDQFAFQFATYKPHSTKTRIKTKIIARAVVLYKTYKPHSTKTRIKTGTELKIIARAVVSYKPHSTKTRIKTVDVVKHCTQHANLQTTLHKNKD